MFKHYWKHFSNGWLLYRICHSYILVKPKRVCQNIVEIQLSWSSPSSSLTFSSSSWSRSPYDCHYHHLIQRLHRPLCFRSHRVCLRRCSKKRSSSLVPVWRRAWMLGSFFFNYTESRLSHFRSHVDYSAREGVLGRWPHPLNLSLLHFPLPLNQNFLLGFMAI